MYRTFLKAVLVDALTKTFNSAFPSENFRNGQVHVSIEYPMERQHYPGIWVNFEDQDSLTIAGINHREFVYDDPDNPFGIKHEVTRWLFSGEVTLTIVALTSRERDDLYDQFVRVFAFSRVEDADTQTDFRSVLENNPAIALRINWDELRPHGDASAPGTPWGTDNEVIYEISIGFDVEGEFISDQAANELLSLSRVVVEVTNADAPEGENPYILGIPPAP